MGDLGMGVFLGAAKDPSNRSFSCDILRQQICYDCDGLILSRGFREGLDLLCRAYDADPGQPGVLSLLARFCIQRGDWQRARELATAAHAASESAGARALALTLQARAHHAEGNYNLAYRSYQQVYSLSSHSRLILPYNKFGVPCCRLWPRRKENVWPRSSCKWHCERSLHCCGDAWRAAV